LHCIVLIITNYFLPFPGRHFDPRRGDITEKLKTAALPLNRGIFSRSIHRRAIPDRGTVCARITHFWLAFAVRRLVLLVTPLFHIRAPAFEVGTVRRL